MVAHGQAKAHHLLAQRDDILYVPVIGRVDMTLTLVVFLDPFDSANTRTVSMARK